MNKPETHKTFAAMLAQRLKERNQEIMVFDEDSPAGQKLASENRPGLPGVTITRTKTTKIIRKTPPSFFLTAGVGVKNESLEKVFTDKHFKRKITDKITRKPKKWYQKFRLLTALEVMLVGLILLAIVACLMFTRNN